MHQSPLEKLRALPENKRNAISFGAATFIAVLIGYAQISSRLSEGEEGTRVAKDAPSAFEGLSSILSEGKQSVGSAFTGLGDKAAEKSGDFWNSKPITAGSSTGTGSAPATNTSQAPVRTIDITQ
jgi:hypothetical protein